MGVQLRPMAILRKHTDGHAPLVTVTINGKAPPPEYLELRIGPNFTSKSMLAQTMRDLAMVIEGAPFDLEPMP